MCEFVAFKLFIDAYSIVLKDDSFSEIDYVDVICELSIFNDYIDENCKDIKKLIKKSNKKFNKLFDDNTDLDDIDSIYIDKILSKILKIFINRTNKEYVEYFRYIFDCFLMCKQSFGDSQIDEIDYYSLDDACKDLFCKMNESEKIECKDILFDNEKLWREYEYIYSKQNEKEDIEIHKQIVIRAWILKYLRKYLNDDLLFPSYWNKIPSYVDEISNQSDVEIYNLNFLIELKKFF